MMQTNIAGQLTTAGYIVKGFFEHSELDARSETTLIRSGGELNLMDWLTSLSHEVESRWDNDRAFNGVWDYEVSEALGHWVAEWVNEHFEVPSDKEVSEQITTLIDEVAYEIRD